MMADVGRDVGEEILEGIRQLKRGEHGRIVNVPAISITREKTGLSQSSFAELRTPDPRESRRLT